MRFYEFSFLIAKKNCHYTIYAIYKNRGIDLILSGIDITDIDFLFVCVFDFVSESHKALYHNAKLNIEKNRCEDFFFFFAVFIDFRVPFYNKTTGQRCHAVFFLSFEEAFL